MKSWLSGAIVAALVSGAVCFLLHYTGAFPVRPAEVPPLRGLSQLQARELLGARDLMLVLDGETIDPLPPGTVAQQRPLPGSQLLRGSTVYAQLAIAAPAPAAPPAIVPPAVVPPAPHPPDAAVAAPPPAPAAPIVPAPVAHAPPAAPSPSVARAAAIPSLVGKRLPQAREIVERSGYVVGNVRYASDNDVGPDRVLRQQPAAGSAAPRGTAIDLVVNEGE